MFGEREGRGGGFRDRVHDPSRNKRLWVIDMVFEGSSCTTRCCPRVIECVVLKSRAVPSCADLVQLSVGTALNWYSSLESCTNLYEKRIKLNLSGNEFYYTACYVLVILNNSRRQLHYQIFFNLTSFHIRFGTSLNSRILRVVRDGM